ncbi:hypothetical protein ACS0TY_023838 [Phlomoides rotata]
MHATGDGGGVGERRLRPHNHQALKCPRCDSLNTKFCYYNNYNLSQPRHFCKTCRRYWTKGGVLRSVPVGGACRKNKRSKAKNERKSNNAQSSSSETTTTDSPIFSNLTVNPNQPLVDGQIFSSLMTSSEFDISYGRDQPVNHVQLVAEDPSPEFKLQDWGGDQDLFDLTADVDPSYWNQPL